MAIEVGSKAPDFSLTHRVGQPPVTLGGTLEKGPTVVLFYPLAFSGVCTDEVCQVAEDFGRWDEVGAQVLGVSVDSSWVNNAFAEVTGATFPLLSDFNREAMTAFGVRNDDFFGMKGVANRSAFVISQEGTVVFAWETHDADVLPPFDDVLAAVQALG